MTSAREYHAMVPSFPSTMHMAWVPLLLTVLVPTTRSQHQRNVTMTEPDFKYQHENGSLGFEVDCFLWNVPTSGNAGQRDRNPATCSFKVTPDAPGLVDTYVPEKLPKTGDNSSSRCIAKVLLEQESVSGNQEHHLRKSQHGTVTAPPDNRTIYDLSIHIRANMTENLQLKCVWSYPKCPGTRQGNTPDCEPGNASTEAKITLGPQQMRENFTQYAEIQSNAVIQSKMTQSLNDSHTDRIDATLGTNLTFICRVKNLDALGDHVCKWLFWPQNYPTSPSIDINKTTLNSSFFGEGRLSISSESGGKFCNLDIRRTQLRDEGNWSCAPGPGKKGWIHSSPKVELRLGSCSTDEECQRGGYQESACHNISAPSLIRSAGAELKSACIHPCDSKQRQDVCQPSNSSVCNGTCLPTCEFHPCRSYDACMPHVRSGAFDKQRCVCHEGTFAIDRSDQDGIKGCMAPHFGGLRMQVSADKEETQACNFTDNNETEPCTFSVLEGANITFICSAARIFPEPQLQILGNNYESFVHSSEGVETTSLSGFEGRSQEMNRNHSSDQEPKLVKDYMIEARLLHATKDGHNKATFECHFNSEAQEAKVRVILTVRGQQESATTSLPEFNGNDAPKADTKTQGGMGIIVIVLITLAAVLVMATLVFIFVRRKRNNHQQRNPNDGGSHNCASGKGLQEQAASKGATQMTDNVTPGTSLNDGGREQILHNRVRYVAPDGQAEAVASVTANSGDRSADRGDVGTEQMVLPGRHQHGNAGASNSKSGGERGGLHRAPASPPQHGSHHTHQQHRENKEKTHEELIYATLDLDNSKLSSSSRQASSSHQGTKRNVRHPHANPDPRRPNHLLVEGESTYATIIGEIR